MDGVPDIVSETGARRFAFSGRSHDAAGSFEKSAVRPRAPLSPPIAVIDGPYDSALLGGIAAHAPLDLGRSACAVEPNGACRHGTFIMGLLSARPDAPIPGLCPDSPLLHVPLFVEASAPSATLAELAQAIRTAVSAGARLINLSLAIQADDPDDDPELASALDLAHANGGIVLAAAGNQARLAAGQLLSHPAIIPVVAVDAENRVLPDSNFGPSIALRGVAAPGDQIFGYAPGGGTTFMSGSSVATAVATGMLAQAWALRPDADAAALRAAVARFAPRGGPVPPVLARDALLAALDRSSARTWVNLQGAKTMNDGRPLLSSRGDDPGASRGPAVIPASGAGGCSCGAPGGQCSCGNSGSSPVRFIYALGTLDVRFPNQGVVEELQSVAIGLSHKPGGDVTLKEPGADEPLRSWYFRVLKNPEARYIARQLHWLLKIEGQPAYYLSLRDLHDLPDLIGRLGREEPKDPYEHEDLDLFVGTSSLVAADHSPGILAPILMVDQIAAFEKADLIDGFELSAKKTGKGEPASAGSAGEELFRRLVKSADNLGDTDDWRALNFLAVRYRPLYELYAELVQPGAGLVRPKDGWTLDSIKVARSRLAREKRIVDPIFAFRNNNNGVVQKYFVRVDVSYLFPTIVNHIAEYFDR